MGGAKTKNRKEDLISYPRDPVSCTDSFAYEVNQVKNSALTTSTYIKKYMFRVDGWMENIDAEIFRVLIGFQTTCGYHGSLVEIGVHHGRSFFILALSRAEGEKILAIDTFEGSNRDVKFFENRRKFGIPLADSEIYRVSSLDIDANVVLARAGRTRFFSVDGGHMFHHVENDLQIAKGSLTPEGIIVIDDFCNSLWPEVTFASYDFLKKERETIVPFLMSRGKLYCSTTKHASTYREHIASRSIFNNCIRHEITMLGSDVLILTPRITDRFKNEIKDRIKKIVFRN